MSYPASPSYSSGNSDSGSESGLFDRQKVANDVKTYIAENRWLPAGVDWQPVCEALAQTGPLRPTRERRGERLFTATSRRVLEKLGLEESPYIHYIPSWTDPDHVSEHHSSYSDNGFRRQTTDPLSVLAPALRGADAVKGATAYAKRWGIHPAEMAGRSCLSPLMGHQPREHLSQDLAEHLARGINERHVPLEQLVSEPETVRLVQNTEEVGYLRRALREQDYQRVIFEGLTTDEMVQGNAHTMSNAEVSDLQGPLHPLVDLAKWERQSERGHDAATPKYVYMLNGERREWDPNTNTRLWEALQPCLQLVTRILEREPPFLQSMMDMRTRQIVPDDENPNDEEFPYTCTLVDVSQVDMTKCPGPIQKLDELGYDWVGATERILDQRLRLIIGTGWHNAHSAESQTMHTFGETEPRGEDMEDKPDIVVTLSADMIWPLLVPDYSSSEKLMTSFALAVTLLHELSHAIYLAQVSLGVDARAQLVEARRHGQEPDETTYQLVQNDEDVLGGFNGNEPYDQGTGGSESGFGLEWSLFESMIVPQISHHGKASACRDTRYLPFALRSAHCFYISSSGNSSKLLASKAKALPFEHYYRTVPIDYISKFFTQRFWDTDFNQYGWEALKMWPATRWHKVCVEEDYIGRGYLNKIWRIQDQDKFCGTVSLLQHHGYPILSEYLWSSAGQLIRASTLQEKWLHEICRLKRRDHALPHDLGLVGQLFERAFTANANFTAGVRGDTQPYLAFCDMTPRGVERPPFQDYQDKQARTWRQSVREGSDIMRQLSKTLRHMLLDIEYFQKMVFDFLMLDHERRAPFTVDESEDREKGIMKWTLDICKIRQLAAARVTQDCVKMMRLNDFQDDQTEQKSIYLAWQAWAMKFGIFGRAYAVMGILLENEQHLDRHQPHAHVWMSQLDTVPSQEWKTRPDRLRDLANLQYPRLDPRIRVHIDECAALLERSSPESLPLFDQPSDVEEIGKLMAKMQAAHDTPESDSAWIRGIFPHPFSLPQAVQDSQQRRGQGSSSVAPPPPPPTPAATSSGTTAALNGEYPQLNSNGDLRHDRHPLASIFPSAPKLALGSRFSGNPGLPVIPPGSGFSRYATEPEAGATFSSSSRGGGGDGETISFGSGGVFPTTTGSDDDEKNKSVFEKGKQGPRPFPYSWADANFFQEWNEDSKQG